MPLTSSSKAVRPASNSYTWTEMTNSPGIYRGDGDLSGRHIVIKNDLVLYNYNPNRVGGWIVVKTGDWEKYYRVSESITFTSTEDTANA